MGWRFDPLLPVGGEGDDASAGLTLGRVARVGSSGRVNTPVRLGIRMIDIAVRVMRVHLFGNKECLLLLVGRGE